MQELPVKSGAAPSSAAVNPRNLDNLPPRCGITGAWTGRMKNARFMSVNSFVSKALWLGVLVAVMLGQGGANAQTIRRITAPGKFYTDDKQNNGVVFNYAAYMISNSTASTLPGWLLLRVGYSQ